MPLVDQAQRRVACREGLQRALDSGNVAEIQRCYVPELLDDYPAALPLVQRARQITETARVLGALDAARNSQNWQAFLQTWQAHQATLADRPEAAPYRQEVNKLIKVAALRRLLADPRADGRKIVEAWSQLQSLGGHPAAEAIRAEVERRTAASNQLLTIKALIESAPRKPTAAHDKQLVEAWRKGGIANNPRAASLQQHVAAAQSRLVFAENLTSSSSELTLAGERSIVEAAKKLDAGYHPLLRHRAQQARDRLKAYRALQEAFQTGEGDANGEIEDAFRSHGSDREILEAWRLLERAGGQKLVSEEVMCRIQLAAERVPLIKALQLINDTLPPAERDRRILRVWKESLLHTCEDARPWLTLYESAVQRKELFARIDAALAAEDVDLVTQFAASPCLRGFPLPDDKRARVEALVEHSRRARLARQQGLSAALLDNNRSTFHDLFDREMIRDICEQYSHHRPVVCRWVESEIVPATRSGLAPADGAIEEIDAAHYRLRWTWPAERISDVCHLAVCPQRPQPNEGPKDVEARFAAVFRREQYNPEAGFELEVSPEWNQHHVVVWAEIDLGFEVMYSEPVVLGQLQLVKKRRWFG
jgi:hypothetical protein